MKIKTFHLFRRGDQNQNTGKENGAISYWIRRLSNQGELKNAIPPATNSSAPHIDSQSEKTAKYITAKKEDNKVKLDELVRKSNRRIISISSTFPWDFFPNTIEIEESRINFIFRQFMSFQTHSVDIRDISSVFLESGFLFATLQVVSRTYIKNDIRIDYLWKEKAMKVKRIIEALRTFAYNNIDTSNYEINELIDKLQKVQTHQLSPAGVADKPETAV